MPAPHGRPYRRLFRLRFFSTREREVEDEFQFHLEMRTAELARAGHTPENAHTEALRQFGDVNDAQRYCRAEDRRRMRDYRRTMWVDNLRHDVRLSWRTMRRQPAFAFTTVLVLAVAIAITTAAYGVVHAYVVRPLPYPNSERLVQLIAGPSRQQFPNAPSLAAVDWTVADSVFDATVAWDLDGFTLAGGQRPEYVDGAWVSPGYFSALGLRPAIGRGFGADDYAARAQVAIISDALWSRRFGRDPGVVGTTIRAHSTDRPRDNELVTVVGVMPADAWHMSRFTDVLRPLSTPRFPSLARLEAGMSIDQAQTRLNAVVLPQLGAVDSAWHLSLVSVQDEYTRDVRPILLALLGAAAFLLLIGGASVAGAQVARAAARRAEIQVRVALGASRGRIVGQLLTESMVLAALAALIGVVLAGALLQVAGTLVGEQLRASVPGGADRLQPDGIVLGSAIMLGTLVGVAFGMLPALLSARVNPEAALRGADKGSATRVGSPRLRRILIAAQVAFTMMLLVGAGLMTRTILAIGAEPLGFRYENVVKASLLLPMGRYPDATSRRLGIERMLAALSTTPGVHSAAVASPHPFRGPMQLIPITAEGQPDLGDHGPRAVQYVVTPEYFGVMDIPITTGRRFGALDDASSLPVVVISDRLAASLWPGALAVGRRLRMGADSVWHSVVGIAGDTREVVSEEQQPDIYLPYAQVPRAYVSVLTRTSGDPARMTAVLPREVAKVDDVLALAEVEPMSDVVSRDGRRHRALATVLVVYAGFALGLAMLGLYSALAYVVTQRRREIAIRVAVGSNAHGIARLVLGEGVPVVVAGLLAGTALSLALTRTLATQLYGVTPTDPATFAAIAIGLAVAALGAIALPIRQAMRVEPAAVLRAD